MIKKASTHINQNEGTIFERSRPGKVGYKLAALDVEPGRFGRVIVEDTGVGMKGEDIPRALAPFSQIDNVLSRKHRGTGLGLSLVRSFVELHGGEVHIQSAPGEGTIVTCTLPVDAAPALAAAEAV